MTFSTWSLLLNLPELPVMSLEDDPYYIILSSNSFEYTGTYKQRDRK